MIRFESIAVRFGRHEILRDVSFALPEREITALIGKNGSGKSTLLSCLTGTVPYRGTIRWQERDLAAMPPRERAQRFSLLPQLLPHTAVSVEELVRMGRNPYLDLGRRLTPEDHRAVDAALHIVGLETRRQAAVAHLSGGEKQKAFLAMILAQDTPLLVLDEPTTYMDMENEADFLALIRSLCREHGKTVFLVMHDLTRAVELADHIVVLGDGRALFTGSADECVASGVIEQTFHVHRGSYEKDGAPHPLYYR